MVAPYDEALVITLKIVVNKVAYTLVDKRSLVDIIFKDTLDQLTLEFIKITLNNTPLVSFTGEIVIPKDIVTCLF